MAGVLRLTHVPPRYGRELKSSTCIHTSCTHHRAHHSGVCLWLRFTKAYGFVLRLTRTGREGVAAVVVVQVAVLLGVIAWMLKDLRRGAGKKSVVYVDKS